MYIGVRRDVRVFDEIWRFSLSITLLLLRAQRFVVGGSRFIANPQDSSTIGRAISYRRQHCLPVRCAPILLELVNQSRGS